VEIGRKSLQSVRRTSQFSIEFIDCNFNNIYLAFNKAKQENTFKKQNFFIFTVGSVCFSGSKDFNSYVVRSLEKGEALSVKIISLWTFFFFESKAFSTWT